jgi:hypothetical protein
MKSKPLPSRVVAFVSPLLAYVFTTDCYNSHQYATDSIESWRLGMQTHLALLNKRQKPWRWRCSGLLVQAPVKLQTPTKISICDSLVYKWSLLLFEAIRLVVTTCKQGLDKEISWCCVESY